MPRAESLQSSPIESSEPIPAARPRRRLTPLKWFGLSLAVFGVTIGLECLVGSTPRGARWVGLPGFGAGTLLALTACVRSVADLFRGDTGGRGSLGNVMNLGIALSGFMMTGLGALAALFATYGFSRGRQLRRFGRVLLPTVKPGSNWLGSAVALENTAHAPPGLGQQWRENGRTEHASVASFARLTLDLMALGAKASLITSANEDALDEIRHTEACFALAHALDGGALSPGPFPEAQRAHALPRSRTLALAELAVLSLIDGALHEGVSARIIAKLARRSQHPAITQILKQIAADEGRHAAHGWDVVEWCLAQGGAPVAHALSGAARNLPEQLRSSIPPAASDGSWEAWGIHGHELERIEYAAARAEVTQRVRRLVALSLAASAAQRAA